MEVISKAFSIHKRGESPEDNQDSVCMSENNMRFALSDGVSMSFLPHIISKTLTSSYVNANSEDLFPPEALATLFKEARDKYMTTLDDFSYMLQEGVEKEFKNGAATFVGVELCNGKISWQVIGDSCLFLLPHNKPMKCICSEKVEITEDNKIKITFGNHPAQIHSDGTIVGKILKGEMKMTSGWYIMMSDAMSAWFIDRINQNENDIVERLYNITDIDGFENLIEHEYNAGRLKNDDCSMIAISILTSDMVERNNQFKKTEPTKDEQANKATSEMNEFMEEYKEDNDKYENETVFNHECKIKKILRYFKDKFIKK